MTDTPERLSVVQIEQKIMDYNQDKYDLIVLGSMWAREIRRREEFRHKPNSEVIDLALSDVLSGKITRDSILENYRKHLLARQQANAEKEAKRNAKPVEMTLPEL
ncbi:MAG: hypothetical protein WCS77_06805 [Elusimicrobiaceae bacterium]|jgi:DNA-directed RNA polymerase subunit K/omega